MSKSRNHVSAAEFVNAENQTAGIIADEPDTDDLAESPVFEIPPAAEAVEPADNPADSPGTLVYIGPTIFKTALISGRVFITGGRPIDEILTDELRRYPLARQMFVTPSQAAEAMKKINNPGTALGNAYKQLSGGK